MKRELLRFHIRLKYIICSEVNMFIGLHPALTEWLPVWGQTPFPVSVLILSRSSSGLKLLSLKQRPTVGWVQGRDNFPALHRICLVTLSPTLPLPWSTHIHHCKSSTADPTALRNSLKGSHALDILEQAHCSDFYWRELLSKPRNGDISRHVNVPIDVWNGLLTSVE